MEIRGYLTNLGAYSSAELLGEWISFPISEEETEAVLKRLRLDNGQEYFFTDWDAPEPLREALSEYESIDTLNRLADHIAALEVRGEDRKLLASLAIHYCDSADMVGAVIETLDNYTFYDGITKDAELGEEIAEGIYGDDLGPLGAYIDYERFGRDVALEEGGIFTDYGYISGY